MIHMIGGAKLELLIKFKNQNKYTESRKTQKNIK